MTRDHISRAAEILGSQRALADAVGVTPGAVSQWALGIHPVPIERAVQIDRATSGAVTRRDLRPDDWGDIWPELIDAEHPWPAKQEAA